MGKTNHEKPWGARELYTGGGAGTAQVGPGMVVGKKRKQADAPKAKFGTAVAEIEAAAYAGMTVAQFRARAQAHEPAATKAKAAANAAAAAQPLARARSAPEDSMEDSGGWFYCDKSGDVQGPFGSAKMRASAKDGALDADVKVRPWHMVEYRPLAEFTVRTGPLAADAAPKKSDGPDPMNVGPSGRGGSAASAWTQITEGIPPNVRHYWWNTLTDEKRRIPPMAPGAAQQSKSKPAVSGMDGLGAYGSGSDSESDED